MKTKTPHLREAVFVAGPNGSGKSTAVDAYIKERFSDLPYFNADLLVREWQTSGDRDSNDVITLRAAREVDAQVDRSTEAGESFVVETVLSSGKYRPVIDRARSRGLVFRLVYVTTVDPALNVERVRQRVAEGGHDVPPDRIVARWERSMSELVWFAARADRLLVLDNSSTTTVVLALRHLGQGLELTNAMPEHPAVYRLRDLVNTPAI